MSEREAKRDQFNQSPPAGRKFLVPILALVAVLIAAGGWYLVGTGTTTGPQLVTADPNGQIRFAAADFSDGQARFYRLQGQSGPVDFFLVRSQDGVIRSAFDTCDVCYKARKGYRQEGHDMVCNNCDQRFRTDMINVVKGGCNPAPLRRQQVGESIVIASGDIEQGSWYFNGAVN